MLENVCNVDDFGIANGKYVQLKDDYNVLK